MSKFFKKGWYVLYVKARWERKIEGLMIENQLKPYLPMIKTLRKWSDRKKLIEVPLFPSYIFANIDNSMEFHKLLSIEGACSFIRFGLAYAMVTDSEINKIKLLVGSQDVMDLECRNEVHLVGEKKIIKHGPLRGLECEILQSNTHKILVRIDSIKQNIIATIPSIYLSQKIQCVKQEA